MVSAELGELGLVMMGEVDWTESEESDWVVKGIEEPAAEVV